MNIKLFIVFVICAKLTFAFEKPVNFVSEVSSSPSFPFSERIINGQNASPTQFPWHARIFSSKTIKDVQVALCGGAIITDLYVLTAAHCLTSLKVYNLGFGSVNLYAPAVTMISTVAFVHPNFNNFANDIAIIKLPNRLSFSATIQPIRLPKLSQNSPNNFVPVACSAAGYGTTSDVNPMISTTLKWVDLKTINNTACSKMYPPGIVTPSIICSFDDTNSPKYKNICHGDSGGGLVFKENGIFTHIGITSFASSAGCQQRYGAGYTRTAFYLSWIKSVTNISLRP